jgi:hypothetical protein
LRVVCRDTVSRKGRLGAFSDVYRPFFLQQIQ